jgi:cytidylate kinase
MVATTTHHHIFIVTGPAGCGKSTVAKFLAARYGFEYIEGDDVSIVFACISMHFWSSLESLYFPFSLDSSMHPWT